MPTPEQWLEAEKRGLLSPEKKAILEEARKRGIMPQAASAQPQDAIYKDELAKELKRRDPNIPRVPSPNDKRDERGQYVYDNTPEEAATANAERIRAEQAAEKEAQAQRTPLRRLLDADAFIASLPVRALTRGQYGMGDVLGGYGAGLGRAIAEGERGFAEANKEGLEAAAAVGEVTAGIPGGQAMGAPLRGMAATANTLRALPKSALPQALQRSGAATQALTKAPSNARAVAAGVPENIQTIPERLADMQAFRELGMKPFAPSLGSSGTARAGRTIEELPIVGGTVKSPKTDIELKLAETQAQMGRELGSRGSEETTGTMLQKGLERYQGAGLTELDPAAIKAQGVNPYQPLKKAQVLTEKQADNMQAAAPIRAANQGGTAQTSRGATVPTAKPLEQIGKRRTNVEDLSDAQVSGLVKASSRDTSFAARGEALYESAWRKIPDRMRKDDSANPNRTGWKNLQNALREIEGETNNQIAGQNTLTGELAQRIMTARSHTSVGELRSIRTELGRTLGNFGQFDIGLDRTQLKRLYAAASRDMEAGLTDIANRAWLGTQSKGKDFVKVAEARKADAALFEFRRADRYFRQGMERIDRFMSVLGAKTPNEAAKKVVTALKEKTANPQMLREITRSLRPEEANALRGYVIEQLGRGRAGANMAEAGFNINNWATDFNAIMSHPGGREFMQGLPGGVAKKLQNMARVVNRMKYYEATKNFSGTAYTGLGVLPLLSGDIATMGTSAAMLFGGGGLGGKLLTSNAFLSWQEALMKAQLKAGNTAASNAKILAQYVNRLPAISKNTKDLDEQRAITALGVAAQQYLEQQKARN